ncbi:hypothetical protein [Gordonia neofelifaecis]|nr:hypothetical protein [Gordonia neofelifaecis]
MGVPVRTSVGAAKWFPHDVTEWPATYPRWSWVRTLDEPEYRTRYMAMLDARRDTIRAELDAFHSAGQPVCLLCHCNLAKPGAWCHRRLLAEYLGTAFGLTVPELGATATPW